MKTSAKIWFTMGFVSALLAYSLYPVLWDKSWYHLTAISFVCYTRVIYLQSRGKWSLIAFIVWLTTVSALVDELFFDPTLIEWNEYLATLITILITIKYRRLWTN